MAPAVPLEIINAIKEMTLLTISYLNMSVWIIIIQSSTLLKNQILVFFCQFEM